mmetsp:Transcript_27529/g.75220  ORF Transcript_27529/g.75220 Transcript_27529/m.75220 type:complete len:209 (+) Transcript_27529:1275-1901(+)
MRKEQPSGQRTDTTSVATLVSSTSVVQLSREAPARLNCTAHFIPSPQAPSDSPHSTWYETEDIASTTGGARIASADRPATRARVGGPALPIPWSLLARNLKMYAVRACIPAMPTLSATSMSPAWPDSACTHLGGSAPAIAISTCNASSTAQPSRKRGSLSRTSLHSSVCSGMGASGASGTEEAGKVRAVAGALQAPLPAAFTDATLKA